MVDIDGTYKYSNIVAVTLPFTTGNITVSPNPVINEVKIMVASPEQGNIQWKLIDNVGRILLKGSEQVSEGPNTFIINMSRLPAGTYYLNVTSAGNDQKVKMQKL